jgi:dihydropteroate synthase type 2
MARTKPVVAPRLVGVVNITKDSFSDGGRYLAPEDALAHARRLRSEGADVIELGPASSHPDAAQVSAEEERRRVAPVIQELVEDNIPVSVDSLLPDTQRFALAHGASYLNDIQGFPEPDLYPALAAATCQLIVMHSVQRAGPATRVATDAAAVSNPEPSLAVLSGIQHLKARFGLPVLVSPSRKSFLRRLTGRDTARIGPATLAAELYAVWQGVDYVRTHDVAALRDALTVLYALTGYRSPPPSALDHPG